MKILPRDSLWRNRDYQRNSALSMGISAVVGIIFVLVGGLLTKDGTSARTFVMHFAGIIIGVGVGIAFTYAHLDTKYKAGGEETKASDTETHNPKMS